MSLEEANRDMRSMLDRMDQQAQLRELRDINAKLSASQVEDKVVYQVVPQDYVAYTPNLPAQEHSYFSTIEVVLMVVAALIISKILGK